MTTPFKRLVTLFVSYYLIFYAVIENKEFDKMFYIF